MANLYQVVQEDEFEIRFQQVTLETATDVTYEWNQLQDYYNLSNHISSVYNSRIQEDERLVYIPETSHHFFYWSKLITHIRTRLEKERKVEIFDLSPELESSLKMFNRHFKKFGFVYRSGQYFSKYNNRKTKNKKVSGSVMNQIKSMVVLFIERQIAFKEGVSITFDNKGSDESRIMICRFAIDKGMFKLDDLLSSDRVNCWDHNPDVKAYNGKSFRGWLSDVLATNHNEDMLEPTMDAFYDWWQTNIDSHVTK